MRFGMDIRRILKNVTLAFDAIKHQVVQKARPDHLCKSAAGLARLSPGAKLAEPDCWLSVIVPVANGQAEAVRQTVASLDMQPSCNIELILAIPEELDAAYLENLMRGRAGRIVPIARVDARSLLSAAQAAIGDFLLFLQPGDRITQDALKIVWRELSENPEAELLYTDTLHPSSNDADTYRAKPAYDPVLQSQVDYISEAAFYRRDRFRRLEPAELSWESENEAALLKGFLDGIDDATVFHLPFPVVELARHRKASMQPEASTRGSCGTDRTEDMENLPPITVIIPSRNAFDLIRRTLEGLLDGTDYENLDVVVIDNGSDDPRVFELYESRQTACSNFRAHLERRPFNFAAMINKGLSLADDGAVLLLNNDIEVVEPGWLKEMVACLGCEKTGIVGARLLFPDDTIQHAGVVVGLNGMASHWFYKEPKDIPGPLDRLRYRCSVGCVTAAVMLISGECRRVVGPFDEKNFAIAYNDVDFCLRARKAGFRTIVTPHATLYHHESASRGKDRSRERMDQFQAEKEALKRIHGTATFEDPAFSPWYARRPGRLQLRCPKAVPRARTWWG